VDSASNRNEYQESSWGQRTTSAWGSQPHRHLWADCLENAGASTSHLWDFTACYRDSVTFFLPSSVLLLAKGAQYRTFIHSHIPLLTAIFHIRTASVRPWPAEPILMTEPGRMSPGISISDWDPPEVLQDQAEYRNNIDCTPLPLPYLLRLRALQSMMNVGLFYDLSCNRYKFLNSYSFYGVGPSTPHPTPNLEGRGIPFCLDHQFWHVLHGRPYQQLRYRRHSSQDHMATKAPPLRQSRDTHGGGSSSAQVNCSHWWITFVVSRVVKKTASVV
jgi:hypothetical protein